MAGNFYVVFKGAITDGADIEDVKRKLAAMFKTDAAHIQKYFSGSAHIVKKEGDRETCEKIKAAFLKAGAICFVKEKTPEVKSPVTKVPEDAVSTTKNGLQLEEVKKKISKKISEASNQVKPGFDVVKENISKKISEVSDQMKPGMDVVKEKATHTIATGLKSLEEGAKSAGIQALIKNKFFLSLAAACVLLLVVVFGSLTSSGKAMPLTMKNMERYTEVLESITNSMAIKLATSDQLENKIKNDPKLLCKYLARPYEEMGYNFQATLTNAADTLLSDGVSYDDRAMIAIAVLLVPIQVRDDLYANGFISKALKDKLDKLAGRL